MEYETNGYYYRKNEYGQILEASGKLRLETGERNQYAQREAGGSYRHSEDDGGHLIGTRFGGSGEADNLIAEDRSINRGAYKSLENEWAEELNSGHDVRVSVEPVYHGESLRPDIITAKTEIGGENGTKVDYFSVTNENLEMDEFILPEEADEMMEKWTEEHVNMDKTLRLTNDEYRNPTSEELMASGEQAVDQHMDILRDEMRNNGMEDGPEMEAVIGARREESMSELRNGIYGNSGYDSEQTDFSETNNENSFTEAGDITGNSEEYEDIFEENSENSILGASEVNSSYAEDGINSSFTEDVNYSMDTGSSESLSDGLSSSMSSDMGSSLSDTMNESGTGESSGFEFSRGE